MTLWNIQEMMDGVEKEFSSYILPDFGFEEELVFDKLYRYSKEELQTLLVLYAQQKSYVEEIKSKCEASIKVQQGAYDEGYYVALYDICQEYQNNKLRKPPLEELRAEVIARNKPLRDINKNIVGEHVLLSRIIGLLEKITTQYYTTKDFLNR
tara:strand:+ start:887 stop:1345 length:459 start_codon:yes stop_codon:yes gene_type:complete